MTLSKGLTHRGNSGTTRTSGPSGRGYQGTGVPQMRTAAIDERTTGNDIAAAGSGLRQQAARPRLELVADSPSGAQMPWSEVERLASKIVYRTSGTVSSRASLNRDDLMQVAREAAFKAFRDFDPEVGCPFAAFLAMRIDLALRQALRDDDPLPNDTRTHLAAIRAAADSLCQQGVSSPTADQLAGCAGLTVSQVTRALARDARARVDTVLAADGPCLEDRTVLTPEEAFLHKEDRVRVSLALRSLPVRERTIMLEYYVNEVSATDLAKAYGVSKGRISQILKSGRDRIEAWLAANE